jgi:hypothetical protein
MIFEVIGADGHVTATWEQIAKQLDEPYCRRSLFTPFFSQVDADRRLLGSKNPSSRRTPASLIIRADRGGKIRRRTWISRQRVERSPTVAANVFSSCARSSVGQGVGLRIAHRRVALDRIRPLRRNSPNS